jgi:hypothetical protein
MSDASIAERIYPAATPEAAADAAPTTPDKAAPAPETTAAPDAAASEDATLLTGKSAEDGKEEAAPAEPPPAPFEADKITFPEGVKPDPEIFGRFGEIAAKASMSQETAQSLMDLYHTVASAEASKTFDAWKTTREGWVAEVRADKEVGGANLDMVKRTVAKALDDTSLTDPKFREALEVTGIGDNPAAVRTLYRWAKALTEGTHVGGNAPTGRVPRSLAEVMYPNLSQSAER